MGKSSSDRNKVSFGRRRALVLIRKRKGAEGPLRFFARVTAVLNAPVDPLSGMTVNLIRVDSWLADLSKHFEEHEFEREFEVLDDMRDHLTALVGSEARLVRLELADQNQTWVRSSDEYEFRKRIHREIEIRSGLSSAIEEEWIFRSKVVFTESALRREDAQEIRVYDTPAGLIRGTFVSTKVGGPTSELS